MNPDSATNRSSLHVARGPSALLAAVLLLSSVLEVRAQTVDQAPVLEMRDFRGQEVRRAAFRLDAPGTVRLRVVGAEPGGLERFHNLRVAFIKLMSNVMDTGERDNAWTANAWILDARTRQPVWELAASETRRFGEGFREYEGSLELPAGSYEVHYSAFPRGTREFDRSNAERLSLEITGESAALRALDADHVTDAIGVVSLGAESRLERSAFEVATETALELRMLGEATSTRRLDYGWIQQADSRETVWSFDYDRSVHAGGSERNRAVHETLTLPPGRYVAYYTRSSTHNPGAWSDLPPYDPAGWGLSLRMPTGADPAAVRPFDYSPVPAEGIIAALTQAGDGAALSTGFTLNEAMDVRIFALGESSGSRLQDYARIRKARTHEEVWAMDYDETRYAGGATKNRVYEGALSLEPGDYLLEYTTDDSHAYDTWNSDAPLDASLWGVTLFAASPLEPGVVEAYDPANDPSLLMRMVGVGNGQTSRRRIALQEQTHVLIYALGEALGSKQMDDYARITDAAGHTVWEMHYDQTEHAGGSQRNRVFRGTISLPAGEYEVVYRTDASHAFDAWSGSPPSDPASWGISLYRAGDSG